MQNELKRYRRAGYMSIKNTWRCALIYHTLFQFTCTISFFMVNELLAGISCLAVFLCRFFLNCGPLPVIYNAMVRPLS